MAAFGRSEPPVALSGASHTYNIQKQNALVKKWVPKVRRNLRANARRFVNGKTQPFVVKGNRTEGKLNKSITARTGMDQDVIELVSFQFERHGVFVHKGVSRKHPVSNPRTPQEWFNPALNKHLPELADELAKVNTDAAINATRMKIH